MFILFLLFILFTPLTLIIVYWFFSLLGKSVWFITDMGKFFKNYRTRQNVLGENVFVMKKSCSPRMLFGLILSTSEIAWGVDDIQRKSCGGGTTLKGNHWGGTFLDEIVGGGIRFSLCNRLP